MHSLLMLAMPLWRQQLLSGRRWQPGLATQWLDQKQH